jgi:chemotaxis protein MotA
MDPATLIGIALGLVSLLALMIMEGSSPMAIVLLPPLILVFGGTFGAAIAGSAMADVKKIGGWFKLALLPAKVPPVSDRIATLVSLAEKARKEGLLALEAQVKDIESPPRRARTRSRPSSSPPWAATPRPSASSARSSA